MTIHRFYVPALDGAAQTGALSRDQSRQASRVLRLGRGDTIHVFDGTGAEYTATLASEQDRIWQLELTEERRPQREPRLRLTFGLAVLRNERFDLAVQKLTELGVARIAPLAAERSVISYADARIWAKRRARIERIIVEAAEQSERVTLPALQDPLTVSEFLDQASDTEVVTLLERHAAGHISDLRLSAGSASLLVGPEGGWTEPEIMMLQQRSSTVSMGALILRAETAVIAAASYLLFSDYAAG